MNYSEYKKERKNMLVRAHTAISMIKARNIEIPKQLDGFDIRLKIEPDDYADISMFGKFTDIKQEGVIATNRGRGSYKYFVPEYPIKERRETYNSKYWGMSKHNAWLKANQDARKAMKEAAAPRLVFVQAIAIKNGVELGKSALGNVPDDDFQNAEIYQVIREAVGEAKHNLKNLVIQHIAC